MLWRDHQTVPLTPESLRFLPGCLSFAVARRPRSAQRPSRPILFSPDTYVEESNLAYHASALRKALGDGNGDGRYIKTVPKRGYRFSGDVSVVSGVTDAGEPGQAASDTEAPHASHQLPQSRSALRWARFPSRMATGDCGVGAPCTAAVFRRPVVARRALRRPPRALPL